MDEANQTIDWEEIIPILIAFAIKLVKAKKWFRGERADSFSSGKQVEDYVFEGIARHLQYPEKYDPLKGTLVDYLKYNIIRTLVGNDAKSKENQTLKSLSSFQRISDDGETVSYIDALLPFAEAYFDDEIDCRNILSEVEQLVKADPIVENIYIGICCGLKRRDVIQEFHIEEKDYDNGVRRLKTILKSCANKYDLKSQSL